MIHALISLLLLSAASVPPAGASTAGDALHAAPALATPADAQASPQPRALARPPARWPPADVVACRTGTVVFKVAIAPTGRVAQVVVESSPTALMAESVTRTVTRQWLFEPFARADGSTAPAWIRSTMRFDAARCHE